LIGFLTENGPFMLDDASVVSPTDVKLIHRETGWQKAASYIFLESPAGTLFSYPYGHIMRGDINVLLATVLEGMSRSIRDACISTFVLVVRVTEFT
jgi:carboxypeptidase C (cathepsin A)